MGMGMHTFFCECEIEDVAATDDEKFMLNI